MDDIEAKQKMFDAILFSVNHQSSDWAREADSGGHFAVFQNNKLYAKIAFLKPETVHLSLLNWEDIPYSLREATQLRRALEEKGVWGADLAAVALAAASFSERNFRQTCELP
jgi:hypothetical protein